MQNRIVDNLFGTRHVSAGRDSVVESRELTEAAREQWDRSLKYVETLIADHPGLCLGAAVMAGITFGWWVKRT